METLDIGFVLLNTRQQGISLILKELILPDGFDPMLTSFTVRNITIWAIRAVTDLLCN
ncbi:unnamed protein product [Schistosoma margrebowiei]|uniref:Uncharacterized protein n=1 Tax=Schistosoma margrebowiei TaxID=48269 RepID=A0A3P8EWF9_9TREM|nr:unnamed protein product [Schistosoma margrebowiei]